MADHVAGMMVSLAHRLWEMRDDQRAHRWLPKKYDFRFVEMARTTMGILGLGDIGMAIARRALGFEMKVYAVDKHPRTPAARGGGDLGPGDAGRAAVHLRLGSWWRPRSPPRPTA